MKKKCYDLFVICFLVLFPYVVTGCQDKDYYNPGLLEEPADNPQLVDFSTSQTVQLDFPYQVTDGYGSVFNLYAENPYNFSTEGQPVFNSDLEPIGSGIFVVGKGNLTKKLPSYVKKLYACSSSPLLPNLLYAEIVNGVASFERIEVEVQRVISRAPGDFWNRNPGIYLGQYGNKPDVDTHHRPNYVAYSEEIPATTLHRIANAFPETYPADPKYYTDASMYIQQKAKVWLGVIGNGAWWDNSLSYFCFNGTKEELITKSRMDVTEIVAIPSVTLREGGLQIGDYIQLRYYNEETQAFEDEFPAGVTIGWMLRSQGYDESNQSLKQYPYGIFYSVIDWNVEGNGDRNHTMSFNAGTTENPFICFGFEDEYNDNGFGDGDCNDIIFHIATDPHDALSPPPLIDEDEDIVTYDKSKGILAFEDYWPKKGDYDLNDVVVKYTSSVKLVKAANETEVYATEINDVFSLIHTGANYNNAFSYQLPFMLGDINKIEIDDDKASYVTDDNGVIVDLCENVAGVIERYKDPAIAKVYNVKMELKPKTITQNRYNKDPAPYNPFISPFEGVEVHLPFNKPTGRANMSLFGTEDDKSDPDYVGKDLYYISGESNNYPFAIHLLGAEDFVIPTEGISIDHTYADYNKWVESGFENFKNWYFNPNKE